MSFPPFIEIPDHLKQRYTLYRVALYVIFFVLTTLFFLSILFPTLTQTFDFRSPESSKNTLLSPRSPENTPRINGKIEGKGTLIADTAVLGGFSDAHLEAVLEKDSALPQNTEFSLRRSYQSFLYPTSDPVSDFPGETTYHVGNAYYTLRDGTLFPFVSDKAFLSRFPKEQATEASESLLEQYPLSEEWLGFRVGTLLANATGVFVVVSETEARPVGSAEIFLALGYNFDDVISVSEEELGIYKRGKIFLLGDIHPDGTVLFDTEHQEYFVIDHETKHPLLPGTYRDFLITNKHPILVSSKESSITVHCSPMPNIFGNKLSCTTPITELKSGFGNDFELTFTSSDAIELRTLSVSFETAKNRENFMTLLSKIKQRFLVRFGLAQ